MAYSEQKNEIFFGRARNWAKQIYALLEERNRLVDIFQNEAQGSPDFVDTEIATIAELSALKEVMDSVEALINDGAVTQENRIPKLTPFLIEE